MASLATASRRMADNQSISGASSDQRSFKKLKRHRATNGFISSLRSTRREKRLNRNKIRIRYLPERPNEDTSQLVIEILNSFLGTNLTLSDIIFCERVTRWDRIAYPKDIVVTFVNVHRRDHVYMRRLLRLGLPFQIQEELGQERARIFAEAVGLFGESNVFNLSGVIHVITRKKHRHEIRTMWEFRTFLRKISSEMRNVPYYKRDSSDQMYAVYASDSSEEQSFITYGPKREDTRLHKTLRIRKVPEIDDENTKFEVIQYIYMNLNVDLDASDVEYCERVVGWDGCVEPRDIVVTFKYKHLQQRVLYNRKCLEDGRTKILQELTADMAEIWGEAVRTFGEDNVYIVANYVSINIGGTQYPVTSMDDYKNFIQF